MKEILQGTLFGCDLVLKVPEGYGQDKYLNKNTLEEYIKSEKKLEYKRGRKDMLAKIEKRKFGDWFFRLQRKRLDRIIDEIKLEEKDIAFTQL